MTAKAQKRRPKKTKEERYLENLERIKQLRLMDDDFMTKCFEGQIEATELLVHTILGVTWRVVSVKTQDTIKNLQGKSVRLDIHAISEAGRHVNIEVQRQDKGAAPRRARYHASILDANTLLSGEEYENLPETYVIFITEADFFGLGRPLYKIERYIEETGRKFNDGQHIVYVNSEIQDETPLGRLMHDFYCTSADDMHYKVLADRVKHFKETEEGVSTMSRIWEEIRREGIEEGREEGIKEGREEGIKEGSQKARKSIAKTLIELGRMSLEEIALASRLSLKTVQRLAKAQAV